MAKVELEGKLTSKRPCDSGSRARRRPGSVDIWPVLDASCGVGNRLARERGY